MLSKKLYKSKGISTLQICKGPLFCFKKKKRKNEYGRAIIDFTTKKDVSLWSQMLPLLSLFIYLFWRSSTELISFFVVVDKLIT